MAQSNHCNVRYHHCYVGIKNVDGTTLLTERDVQKIYLRKVSCRRVCIVKPFFKEGKGENRYLYLHGKTCLDKYQKIEMET